MDHVNRQKLDLGTASDDELTIVVVAGIWYLTLLWTKRRGL